MKATPILCAAIFSLSLAASTIPAMAQSPFHFGFGYRRPLICVEMTDRQIRNAVRDQGYRNISLNVRNDRRIQVRGTRGGWVHLLRVSTCTGAILVRDRLRPA